MANKKETRIIRLDNTSSVNCPYCGNGNRINDLLFRTSRKIPFAEENRLSEYYYSRYKWIPSGEMTPAGWTEPRRLLSWTDLPGSHLTVRNGFVVEVRNYDGERAQERACVWCHNNIPVEWISRADREIAVYAQPGTEEKATEFIGLLLGGSDQARQTHTMLKSFLLGNSILYDCTGISKLDIVRQKSLRLSGMACKGSVFFVKMDALNGKKEVMDLDTIEWLQDGVSDLYGSVVIKQPVFVVMVPAPGDSIIDAERAHAVLCTRLKAHFTDQRLCIWQSADQCARDFSASMEWLTGRR